MTYLIKTINGDQYEVSKETRDAISALLLTKDRPPFIEIRSSSAIIATTSITSITIYRKDVERLPSQEEELAAFNAEWEKDRVKEVK